MRLANFTIVFNYTENYVQRETIHIAMKACVTFPNLKYDSGSQRAVLPGTGKITRQLVKTANFCHLKH